MNAEINTSKQNFNTDSSQTPIGKLIEFLDKYLPKFPSLFQQKTSKMKIKSEDNISQEIWEHLQSIAHHSKEIFMFQFQRKERNSRRSSDFGVLVVKPFNSEPSKEFFRIEAKLLPTPGTDKDGNSREREYVQTDAGGIQRYKKGFHAPDLSQSAIIGYIQKEDCSHWHNKLNEWIDDLIVNNNDTNIRWDSSDLLDETNDFGKTRKYYSKNTRIVGSKKNVIQLHHYLMELN